MNRKFSLILRILGPIGLMVLSIPVFSQSRFEVINGTLQDHTTHLAWVGLAETAGGPVPPISPLGNDRVATLDELFSLSNPLGLLPLTLGQTQLVATDSTLYGVLSFFADTAPNDTDNCIGPAPHGASCVWGWVADASSPGNYIGAVFWFSPTPGDSAHVNYQATVTLSDYSPGQCSPACFVVHAVPEPSQWAFLSTGLALALCRRRWLTRP